MPETYLWIRLDDMLVREEFPFNWKRMARVVRETATKVFGVSSV